MGVWAGKTTSQINDINTATIIEKGTSPNTGGTANTITRFELASTACAIDGCYDPGIVIITGGTGAGQARQIFEYDGTNKYCYVNRDFKVIPDNTSKYMILYWAGDSHYNEGYVRASSSNTITLNPLASTNNNQYLGQGIHITAGAGEDQTRMIVAYNGTTKVATVDSDWIVQPDTTSIYAIRPFPGFVHGRPDQNSTDNILIRDVIGNKTDFVGIPYTSGNNSIIAHLNTAYYHAHGQAFCYPTTANSVTATSGSGAWGTGGSITEVIPANTLNVAAFDLHWINIVNHSADAEYYIEVYSGLSGSEVKIGCTRSWRDSTFFGGQTGNTTKYIQIPQQAVNTRISVKIYSSNAATASFDVSFEGHYYA